jgi:hypothetical protein
MTKKLLLATLIALLLTTIPAAVVFAKDAISIPYTTFNLDSTNIKTYTLSQVYKPTWQARMDFHLQFNTTTPNTQACIIFPANNTDYAPAIFVFFHSAGDLLIDFLETAGEPAVRIANSKWVEYDGGDEVILDMYQDYLNIRVYNATSKSYTYIIKNFAVQAWNMGAVRAYGGQDYAVSGYISVTVDTGTADLSSTVEIIIQVVPVLATVAVLGVVIKMIKKTGEGFR